MADESETTPKGYTSVDAVETYLGQPLTDDQETACQWLIMSAETYIDHMTRRQWLVPAITGELYPLLQPRIYLRYAPVTSVTQVQTRTARVGDLWLTLNAGTDYELFDADRGEILFVSGYQSRDAVASVSYVPNRPVPNDIQRAATLIVAHSMIIPLHPERLGLERVRVGDVLEEFDDIHLSVSKEADDIIQSWVRPLAV